jgi:hypothetical protein
MKHDLKTLAKETFDARAPHEAEAQRELRRIVERVALRRARSSRLWLLAPSLALAVGIFLVVRHRHEIPDGTPMPSSRGGIHLYVHKQGEPEERALRLDLELQGEQ